MQRPARSQWEPLTQQGLSTVCSACLPGKASRLLQQPWQITHQHAVHKSGSLPTPGASDASVLPGRTGWALPPVYAARLRCRCQL